VPSEEAKMTFFSVAVMPVLVETALAVAMMVVSSCLKNHRPVALGSGSWELALTAV